MLETSPASAFAHTYLPLLQKYQEEMIQRLETLVNIDSGTGQVEGINRIMNYLENWLQELDFTVSLHKAEGFGNNLFARHKGQGQIRILLVGHVDTVYAAGATRTHPFSIKNGIAYGPGVIDMKCGVVMCLAVLRALRETGFDQYGELCVVFNNDEEVGSVGSGALLREVAKNVDVGLVLESSRAMEIITHARKGSDKYTLEVRGIAAHSGAEPYKGRSAVIEMAHKMIAIHSLNALYPGVTFNVTRISSSEPLNVVPDTARCHISVRAPNVRGLNMAATALEQIASGNVVPETSSILTRARGRQPYESTAAIMQLVTLVREEGKVLGAPIVSESKGGVSDANLLMEMGVPVLDSLGPVGGGMHNLEKEHLTLDSLPRRGALLAGLLQRICLSKFTGKEPSS